MGQDVFERLFAFRNVVRMHNLSPILKSAVKAIRRDPEEFQHTLVPGLR